MGSYPAVRVEGLGKRYTVRREAEDSYTVLRDVIADRAATAARRVAKPFSSRSNEVPKSSHDDFWALRDVNFEITAGDRVGVIGRNGAGKSTLLKILSRITDPSEGVARIRGRVASLLEVGTGFHPELTGRENVFLNGAIMGMTKREINAKFDEIAAFAEVERFLDTPVKRYSSGMHVRLAFAVAAHLDPEILVVDEVLAVGDTAFQKKCIDKMQEVARQEGRTVMFVSHSMGTILSLCDTALLLEGGRLIAFGPSQQVTDLYVRTMESTSEALLEARRDRAGSGKLRFLKFELRDSNGKSQPFATSGEDITLAFTYCAAQASVGGIEIAVGVHGAFDEPLFYLHSALQPAALGRVSGNGVIECRIPRLPLLPGRYTFNLFCVMDGEISDWVKNAGKFDVEAGEFFQSGALPPSEQGVFLVDHSWSLSQ